MGLLREGRNLLAQMLTKTHSTNAYYDSTGAVLFVGSGTASCHDPTYTALQGAPVASTMEAGYPSLATNIIQYRGTYTTAQANFEWWEWSIGNSTASCGLDNLNRAWSSAGLGTKVNTQSWQMTASVSLTTALALAVMGLMPYALALLQGIGRVSG